MSHDKLYVYAVWCGVCGRLNGRKVKILLLISYNDKQFVANHTHLTVK